MGKLVTPYEAAQLVGVTTSTLRRWVAAGRLDAIRTPGGHHRYDRDQLARTFGQHPATLPPPPDPARYRPRLGDAQRR